jgi:hypothetical protein
MKKKLNLLIAVAMISFSCMQANAQLSQVRSWTKNGSNSFNQTVGCGNCQGTLWNAPGEALQDGVWQDADFAPVLNAAYVDLTAYNSCISSTNCYYTRGIMTTDFQYSFPTNVTITITGIQLKIFGWADTANTIKDYSVKLMYNNAPIGTDKKKGTFWSSTYSGRTYGSSTDLWGVAWTPQMICDPGWGYDFKVKNMDASSPNRFILDWGYITVYYTVSSLSQSPRFSNGETNADNKLDFELFPNPTNELLSIVAKKDLDNFEVECFNVEGESVFVKSTSDMKENESMKIDVATLPRGIYLLQIVSNGLNYTRKFVKE